MDLRCEIVVEVLAPGLGHLGGDVVVEHDGDCGEDLLRGGMGKGMGQLG